MSAELILYCVKCEWCKGIIKVNNPNLRVFHPECLPKLEYYLMQKTVLINDELAYKI